MADYNNKYSNTECYWGANPHSLVVELAKLLPAGAKILDLGAGEGKDAIYLVEQGFDITAVDSSKIGIKKIKQLAQQQDLSIKVKVDDIISYLDKCGTYDAIIGINVLQFLKQNDINKVIENIQSKTNSEGFNALSAFVMPSRYKKEIPINKGRYLFKQKELQKYYAKWNFIEYAEKWSKWERHGEAPHRHYMVHLLAQKNN
jgi:tellurite methyltransferase